MNKQTLFIILIFSLLSGLVRSQNCQTPGFVPIKVLITPDNNPQETRWVLIGEQGDTLRKGLANSDSLCVPANVCVRFTIFDQAGNGLCCTNGTGRYRIYYNGQLIRSAYKFRFFESTSMGCAGCQPDSTQNRIRIYIHPDKFPAETSWNLVNASGDTLAKGKEFGDTVCVPKTACLTFSMLDSYGDGMCCNHGEGGYQILSDTEELASGGTFTNRATHTFNCQAGSSCASALLAKTDTVYTTFYDDHWYKFKPDSSGHYLINTCDLGNTCRTKIWVYDYCTGLIPTENNAATIAYSNAGCGQQARLTVVLNKNQWYWLRLGDEGDSCQNDAIRWKLSFLGPVVGCMDPTSCTYNPIATVNDPTQCLYLPDTNCPGQPDLVVNSNLLRTSFKFDSLMNNDACYIQEGCLKGFGKRYIMRFSTRIDNIGSADYYIGKPPANPSVPSTQWIWDPCHNHWHYVGYAEYLLFDKNGNPIPAGFKAGFCVMDLNCSLGGGIPKYNCSNQGISKGCGDIYSNGLKCQWIDITDVDTGRYTVVVRVNWDNSPDLLGRIESNMLNNWGQMCVRISKSASGQLSASIDPNCNPFVDCEGQIFGNSIRDCAGVCKGKTKQGNVNGDTLLNAQDLAVYETWVRDSTNLVVTTCRDLNGDNKVNVIDLARLHQCLADTLAGKPSCTFKPLVSNLTTFARLTVDSINSGLGFADIAIQNASEEISALQFRLNGLVIDSLRLLGLGDSGQVFTRFNNSGLIFAWMLGNKIPRNTLPKAFLRVYFHETTSTQLCINSFDALLTAKNQLIARSVGPCKAIPAFTAASSKLSKDKRLIVAPNPFQDHTSIFLPDSPGKQQYAWLSDVQGRIIKTWEIKDVREIVLSGQDLKKGVYVFSLMHQGEIIRAKIMLQ